MDPYGILKLAYALSLLNYYIGLVVYAAPLSTTTKRFGLRLAYHGVIASLLTLCYWALVEAVEKLFHTLGVSWAQLTQFYEKSAVTAATIYGLALAVATAKKFLLMHIPREVQSVASILLSHAYSNLARAATLIAFSEAAVKVLAAVTTVFWSKFVLIGILLYSLPGGVGRRAGVSLIAAGIVLYLGLPFLPLWVDMWVNAVSQYNTLLRSLGMSMGYQKAYLLWGKVTDFAGKPIKVGVITVSHGGVTASGGFVDKGVYVLPYTLLLSNEYLLQYVVEREPVYSRVVTIPDNCIEIGSVPPNPLTAIIYVILKKLIPAVTTCRLDIHIPTSLNPSENIILYWSGSVELISWSYTVDPSNDTQVCRIEFRGEGVVDMLIGSYCNVKLNTSKGVVVGVSEKGGIKHYTLVLKSRNTSMMLKVWGCREKLQGGVESSSIAGSVLDVILHDIPMGIYMLALAYTSAVWSYLMLLGLLIYGFGRVLGESPALILSVRY